MITNSTDEESQEKKEEVIEVDKNNVDNIIKLMEIHSTYVQSLSSSIIWIKNIYLIIIVAIISKIYLNQIDLDLNNNIDPWHGMLIVFVISLFCYGTEGASQYWQAQHLNRMFLLDKILRNLLIKDQKNHKRQIRDMYTYRDIVDEILNNVKKIKDDEKGCKLYRELYRIPREYIRFLKPDHILFTFIFYFSVFFSAIVSIYLINTLIDC